jgi:aryl-alcohol dehydrogenase-like predicted oxidoreductase
MAQLALAWVLRQPSVSADITGASRPQQVEENVAAAGVTRSDDILFLLTQRILLQGLTLTGSIIRMSGSPP